MRRDIIAFTIGFVIAFAILMLITWYADIDLRERSIKNAIWLMFCVCWSIAFGVLALKRECE